LVVAEIAQELSVRLKPVPVSNISDGAAGDDAFLCDDVRVRAVAGRCGWNRADKIIDAALGIRVGRAVARK